MLEHGEGLLLYPVRKGASLNQGLYLGEITSVTLVVSAAIMLSVVTVLVSLVRRWCSTNCVSCFSVLVPVLELEDGFELVRSGNSVVASRQPPWRLN